MSDFDTPRLARLARLLGAPPRTVLLTAARLARRRDDAGDDATGSLRDLTRDSHSRVGDGVGALLATPIADFAQDDVDRALAAPARDDADS